MEEIDNGIRITHEWLGKQQILEFVYEGGRLQITANTDANGKTEVYLTEEETAYALAWMATWYEQESSPLFQVAGLFTVDEPGWIERHDEIIGEELAKEMRDEE